MKIQRWKQRRNIFFYTHLRHINSIHWNAWFVILCIFLFLLICTRYYDFLDIYVSYERSKKQKLGVVNETVPFYLERQDAQVKKNGDYFVDVWRGPISLSSVFWIIWTSWQKRTSSRSMRIWNNSKRKSRKYRLLKAGSRNVCRLYMKIICENLEIIP